MLVAFEDIGTPYAEAMGRLSYSSTPPFMYVADLKDCPADVLKELRAIDKDFALDENYPHSIENWEDMQ